MYEYVPITSSTDEGERANVLPERRWGKNVTVALCVLGLLALASASSDSHGGVVTSTMSRLRGAGSTNPAPADDDVASHPSTSYTLAPVSMPSQLPDKSMSPSQLPESLMPTSPPPTVKPTPKPTAAPTPKPSVAPTPKPSVAPTFKPSVAPTFKPTVPPAPAPTAAPGDPTPPPTFKPTPHPTASPTTPRPTAAPTPRPTAAPTPRPTAKPTAMPVPAPTLTPTPRPTFVPTTSAPTVQGEYTFCSEPSGLTQDDTYSEYTNIDYTYGMSCSSSDDDSDCLLMIGASGTDASGFIYDEDSANYEDTTSTVKFLWTGEIRNGLALGARAVSTTPYADDYSKIDGYSCRVWINSATSTRITIFEGTSGTNVEIDMLTEDSWYTLEFTAEGTDFTCTLYDEDGTTVGSQTISDDTYTSGYSGLVPFSDYVETAGWYVSEYTVLVIPGAPTPAPTLETTEYTFCSEPSGLTQDDTYSEYTNIDYTYGMSCSSSDDDSDCLLMIGASGTDASGFIYDEDSANYEDTTSTVKFLWTGEIRNGLALGARAVSTTPYAYDYSKIDGYSCRVWINSATSTRITIFEGTSGTNVEIDMLTEDSWYTLEFTAEGTDFTCTLYDEDGTTVGSQTISDDTYTSGYSGLVPFSDYVETAGWYVSEYTITVL